MCIWYHGAKGRCADDVMALMPSCENFIDIFGGSGRISLAALRSGKFKHVVYNDLDKRLLNLLMVLRDHPKEFEEIAKKTPASRGYFEKLCESGELDSDKILAAVNTLYSITFSEKNTPAEKGDEGRFRIAAARSGVRYRNYSDWSRLSEIAASLHSQLLKISYENLPFEKIVKRFYVRDGEVPGTFGKHLLFLDPPYGKTQYYKFTVEKSVLGDFLKKAYPLVVIMGDKEDVEHYGDCYWRDVPLETVNSASKNYETLLFANFPKPQFMEPLLEV